MSTTLTPLKFEPPAPLLTRVRFRDEYNRERLAGRHAFICRLDLRMGMFWVWAPTLEQQYGRRHEWGPYMAGDIGRIMDIADTGFFRRPKIEQFAPFKLTARGRKAALIAKALEASNETD